MALSYRFGQVEVRPAERQLLVEGRPAALGARAFDVLMALIDHRDRVVTKDELFDLVWPGLVVEENNLHVQVSTLRKILGAQSVATVPGRGFRFTLPIEEAASAAAPPRNHNLPAQLNSFIGRESELAEIKQILAGSRMVTLTNVGGTGKTRLSLQLAAEVLGDYPDGVWFVELAPLAGEWRVPQAAASVLGVKEEAGRPVLEALVKHVQDRHMLVIFDNCEHLVHSCAELAKELLKAGPKLKILASSREALRIAGEKTYPVPALAAPDSRKVSDVEALAKYDSVRLFVERATAVQPDFALTPRNAVAVADICRRLDGIPLAIELAAARMRALSAEKIADRLDQCFRVLTDGDATALPRQQTLRASIDWSHDLLNASERALFRRLAVFAGGFTLEAAEAVCADSVDDQSEVLDILTHLVEKSLVELDVASERYRLLETVRQYAQERLDSSGEAGETRTRHLDFYLSFAQTARPQLMGPAQGVWLARVDLERDNLLAAHTWCEHAEDGAELGIKLVTSTKIYWISRGLLQLALSTTVEALARAPKRSASRCRALHNSGQLAFFMGRYAEAQSYLEESLSIAHELDDRPRVAAALQLLGMSCLGQGFLPTARKHLDMALTLARQLGDKRGLAAANSVMAQLHRVEGDLETAANLFNETLAIARELGDRETEGVALVSLAMVEIERGSKDAARTMLLDAIAITEAIGSRRLGQSVFEAAAGLAVLRKDWERAARFYGIAEAEAAQTGLRRDPADEAFLLPRIAKARKAMGAAFAAAESRGRALSYAEALAEARA